MKEIVRVLFALKTISSRYLSALLDKNPSFAIVKTISTLEDMEFFLQEDKIDVILMEYSFAVENNSIFLVLKKQKYQNIPLIILAPYNQKRNLDSVNDYIFEPKEGFNKNPNSIKTECEMLLYSYGTEYKVRRNIEKLNSVKKVKNENTDNFIEKISQEDILYKKKYEITMAIVIGASTGGPGVIKTILSELDMISDCPPIFIAQHIHPDFVDEFVKDTDSMTNNLKIKIAKNGDIAKNNDALICPGNKYISLIKNKDKIMIKLSDSPDINGYKPYVDQLFMSASSFAKNVIGVILTGMGSDGARGLKTIFDKGGFTISQDEKSSVVYGMPKAAMLLGGVTKQMDYKDIARSIMKVIAISRYGNGVNKNV